MNKKLNLKKIRSRQLVFTTLIALLLVVSLLITPAASVAANGGSEWTFVTIPDLPEGARIGSLWTDGPSNVYAWADVNDPRGTYLYHWNGLVWTQELSLPGYYYGKIHGNSADDIFVAASCPFTDCTGFERPRMFRFDGVSWQEQTLPSEVGSMIRDISGVPGEVQVAVEGYPNKFPNFILRYDYGSNTWSHIFTTSLLTYVKSMYFLAADEAYYTACWGHARWNGSTWEEKKEFDFCDLSDLWGTRDDLGQLHLYTVGKNNFANGVRVWKYTENTTPALLGTFGSKCGFVFGDPVNGSYICGGVYHIGGATGVWGSAWNDVYVVGALASGSDLERFGRIYHYDGAAWQEITPFDVIPYAQSVGGSGPGNVWVGLGDGRLLRYGVVNQPPIADAGGPYAVDEGSIVGLDASGSTDPDDNIVLYEWDLDNNGEYADASGVTADVSFDDNGIYSVGVKVTDEYDEFDTDTAVVTVLNVAPSIETLVAPDDPRQIGTTVETSATFTDSGVLDTHTATWDWGDETTSAGVVDGYDVSGLHVYDTPGVYTVTLTVVDNDGGAAAADFQYVVVYDPEGGFVTGGGWIWSPAGAYTPDPLLTGKATFGFVSKYKKGATIPTGQTEFQFHAGDLNFKSTSYEWLVIAGARAQYKGVGTINGEGEYRFMLTAIDGQINGGGGFDKFRIKIWDAVTDQIIYDNQPGMLDDGEPSTILEGGSIVIHQAKK